MQALERNKERVWFVALRKPKPEVREILKIIRISTGDCRLSKGGNFDREKLQRESKLDKTFFNLMKQ